MAVCNQVYCVFVESVRSEFRPDRISTGPQSFQPRINRRDPRKQRQRPQFAKPLRALPIPMNSSRQNRNESHACGPCRQSIIHVVAHVKRHLRISSSQNLQQAIRRRLLPRNVVHGHYHAKVPGRRPALEPIRKLLPGSPREKIEFKPLRPPLHLLRRNQHLLSPHIPRPPIAVPVKFLKRVACFLITRRPSERRGPVRNHAPVVVFPGLFFHLESSAHVTRFPVTNRMVSIAERKKLSRTSTSTPSTSKIKISGIGLSRFDRCKVGKAPHGRYRRYRASVYINLRH